MVLGQRYGHAGVAQPGFASPKFLSYFASESDNPLSFLIPLPLANRPPNLTLHSSSEAPLSLYHHRDPSLCMLQSLDRKNDVCSLRDRACLLHMCSFHAQIFGRRNIKSCKTSTCPPLPYSIYRLAALCRSPVNYQLDDSGSERLHYARMQRSPFSKPSSNQCGSFIVRMVQTQRYHHRALPLFKPQRCHEDHGDKTWLTCEVRNLLSLTTCLCFLQKHREIKIQTLNSCIYFQFSLCQMHSHSSDPQKEPSRTPIDLTF